MTARIYNTICEHYHYYNHFMPVFFKYRFNEETRTFRLYVKYNLNL